LNRASDWLESEAKREVDSVEKSFEKSSKTICKNSDR